MNARRDLAVLCLAVALVAPALGHIGLREQVLLSVQDDVVLARVTFPLEDLFYAHALTLDAAEALSVSDLQEALAKHGQTLATQMAVSADGARLAGKVSRLSLPPLPPGGVPFAQLNAHVAHVTLTYPTQGRPQQVALTNGLLEGVPEDVLPTELEVVLLDGPTAQTLDVCYLFKGETALLDPEPQTPRVPLAMASCRWATCRCAWSCWRPPGSGWPGCGPSPLSWRCPAWTPQQTPQPRLRSWPPRGWLPQRA